MLCPLSSMRKNSSLKVEWILLQQLFTSPGRIIRQPTIPWCSHNYDCFALMTCNEPIMYIPLVSLGSYKLSRKFHHTYDCPSCIYADNIALQQSSSHEASRAVVSR